MDFLFELIGEIIFEGLFELSKNKKIPKFIRYPLFILVCLFYMAIVILFIYLGVRYSMLKKIGVAGCLFLIGILLLVLFIYSLKKAFIKEEF